MPVMDYTAVNFSSWWHVTGKELFSGTELTLYKDGHFGYVFILHNYFKAQTIFFQYFQGNNSMNSYGIILSTGQHVLSDLMDYADVAKHEEE